MKQSAAIRSGKSRWWLWLAGCAALALVAFVASVAAQIIALANLQQNSKADAIVVFGAAEYYGRPSPVYRARLDHGFELFQRGIAPIVITTGGSGGEADYSEGGVGRDYLVRRGIPERNLIAETQGADTSQSAERVAVIMKMNGMRNCVAVSDQYHVFRIQKLLEHEGIQVYVSPRPDSRPRTRWQRCTAVLREALSYTVWRLHLT
ncbi:MAG TPA: YdcF family protein [Terriglobales bacterium]|nr:YdcF family protein [Terriglobales bacterium]